MVMGIFARSQRKPASIIETRHFIGMVRAHPYTLCLRPVLSPCLQEQTEDQRGMKWVHHSRASKKAVWGRERDVRHRNSTCKGTEVWDSIISILNKKSCMQDTGLDIRSFHLFTPQLLAEYSVCAMLCAGQHSCNVESGRHSLCSQGAAFLLEKKDFIFTKVI